jgi:hypothetical protein
MVSNGKAMPSVASTGERRHQYSASAARRNPQGASGGDAIAPHGARFKHPAEYAQTLFRPTRAAFSAPRHPTNPEKTKPLRGAGALERTVRHRVTRIMRFVP